MSVEEASDLCKVHFDDFKFIDHLVSYLKEKLSIKKGQGKDGQTTLIEKETEAQSEKSGLENQYTVYVSAERMSMLVDIAQQLNTLLDGRNFSHSAMLALIGCEEKNETMAEEQRESNLIQMKTDPHLQKILELIYSNIKERFAIFGNCFRYLDFKNRRGISLEDFERGLDTFGIYLSQKDRKHAFLYLAQGEENALLNFDKFMRLKEEAPERNVDPFEL